MSQSDTVRRPSPGLLLLEGRALFELAALLPTMPLLRRAPRGDGHPVLVLPPFVASDLITRPLRAFLRDRGYRVHGWKLGRNLGPSPEVALGMAQRLAELRGRYQRRVSLIGWSLGGVYARELARRFPDDVRLVITLGSPFRDVDATNVPRALRDLGKRRSFTPTRHEELAAPLSVPATAIFSRTDAICPWQSCTEDDGPQSENIEVVSSHVGLGHHPVVLLTIADRLAQPEGVWAPFRPPTAWPWPLVPRRMEQRVLPTG